MPKAVEAILLRVFVGEEDRYKRRSLYESIVRVALDRQMAGATVLSCPNGFGISRLVRTETNVDAGPRNPIVVEIIDAEEQINRILPTISDMIESGLVTMERVKAIRYERLDNLTHLKKPGHRQRRLRPPWARGWLGTASAS
jgi:uncharacterized protein